MRVLIFTLYLSIFLTSCKTSDSISPTSSISGVFVFGYDSISKSNGKIWKNDDVFFSNESELSSKILDVFVSGKDVYAVGVQYNVGGTIHVDATLWKNGVATILGDKINNSVAESVYVSGNDVYVCGSTGSSNSYFSSAIVWKNGIPNTLATPGTLSSIFVSGTDVYTCGYTGLNTQGLSVFKNDNQIYFEKGFSFPTSIFVSGNDVYVSGRGYSTILVPGQGNSTIYGAKLWKNGVGTSLDNGKNNFSMANDVFVSGKDVYVVGNTTRTSNDSPNAVLWKNSVAISLTDGNSWSSANSLFVSGNDVYICGFDFTNSFESIGKIWKNGVALPISKTKSNFYPTGIFVVK